MSPQPILIGESAREPWFYLASKVEIPFKENDEAPKAGIFKEMVRKKLGSSAKQSPGDPQFESGQRDFLKHHDRKNRPNRRL